MPASPNRTLLKSVVLLAILLPFVSLSQVKIKEKVQIKPSAQRSAPRVAGTYDFYSPPLFVGDTSFTMTLNSSLAFSGTVSVSDDIGYDQSAEVGCVFHDLFNPSVIYDTALAWKGRQSVVAGGNLFQGQKTFQLTCNRGTAPPEVQLLLWRSGFDGFGERHITGGGDHISYSFTGTRTKLDGSSAPVTGAADVTGSPLPIAMFSGWKIESDPYIQCRGAVVLLITPLDGSGSKYSPAVGSNTLTGSFTVSVTARGNYAYLQAVGQEGSLITIDLPQQEECDLVFDPQRGDIPGGVDTAYVTVTGGGRSAMHKVILYSYGFHFDFGTIQSLQHGEIRQLRAAIRDGCSNDVDYPGLHYYRFELLGNSLAWGVLRDTLTGRSGAVVDSVSSTRIEFDAWGRDTVSPTDVTIRVSVDDGTIEPVTASFTVMPAQMRAILGKKLLSYGDTTSLKIQIQNPDGSWIDKPVAWTGTYTIVQADTFGFLYNLDSTKVGRVIKDTSPILIYYAHPESQPDSIEVLIQLNLEEPPPQFPFGQSKSSGNVSTQAKVVAPQPNIGSGSGKRPPAKVAGGITFGGAIHWGLVRLTVRKSEILLGQTKYYYVLDDHKGNVSIEETPDSSGNLGVPQDVWQGSSVTVATDKPNSCIGLGVYWEKKAPGGSQLLPGKIRLVGRYWKVDSVYRVNLTPAYAGNPSRTIEVTKPNKLGNDYGPGHLGGRRTTVNDVFNQPFNLDSVIISYAGRYGIPPQLIKGQIQKESSFDPSYLYEPFKDVDFQTSVADSSRIYANQYRIISSGDIGRPGLPPRHTNIRNVLGPTSYPGYGGTIWEYYDRYKKSLYARVNRNGDLVYPSLDKVWRESLVDPMKKDLMKQGISENEASYQAVQMANDSISTYLRYVYKQGRMGTHPAQTRIVASYGLMQMIYFYAARGRGYSVSDSNLPENINLTDTSLTYGLRHLKSKFRVLDDRGRILFYEDFQAASGWANGFEGTFRRALGYYSGRGESYGGEVLRNANGYLPKVK